MTRGLTLAIVVAALAPLAAAGASQDDQEHRKVPKDSVQVTVQGCLKGRVLKASDVRETDVQSGPIVRNRAFRLAGPKDLMSTVKENDGGRVEVVGLIKKSALVEPGWKIKGGRIVIGGGTTRGGAAGVPDPADNVVVLDLWSLQVVGSCR